MPWGDWQFWLVTLAALWGLWSVIRKLTPRRDRNELPCSTCAVGPAAQAGRKQRRQSSTVSGDPPQ